MRKISIIISSLLLILITFTKVNSEEKFSSWIIEFKKKAINEGISEKTVDSVMTVSYTHLTLPTIALV